MRIFVHLARDKDVQAWREARDAGTLVGVNDETPYGYGRAEAMGCRVTFSRSEAESSFGKVLRLSIRVLSGFDYFHARRQGQALAEADVVWTHTESQFLAVAALMRGRPQRPKLLGQSVWLFDRWRGFSALRRWLYRRLMADVDVLTCHSELNLAEARTLFPDHRSLLVPFGIPSERVIRPRARSTSPVGPVAVLSLGSDQDRDWPTLVEAVRGRDDMTLTILSGTADPRLVRGLSNAMIARARTNAELDERFASATVVCVPLRPNKHASGITVIQEAVLAGVPVVATDAGGLSGYFAPDEIRYVPPGDATALRSALLAAAADAAGSLARAEKAQARMAEPDMGAEAFIRRHVEISRDLLQR